MIEEKIFAVFEPLSPIGSLAGLAVSLLDNQKVTWPQLASGYASLGSIRTREIKCNGYSAWLQFNPGRIVSTGANVDPKSIQERRCFLCVQNLPVMQKGALYKDEFLVLCNPAPIFAEHFTISHIEHIPQLFGNFSLRFLELARDLSPLLSVFYNGPKCGASAPDHMHFQACPTGTIPVETAAVEPKHRHVRTTLHDVRIVTLKEYGRQVIVLESKDLENLQGVLNGVVGALNTVTGTTGEPMMNIVCSYSEDSWRVILFPRSKHRPDAYFKEGDDRILVSPAAVDIGGLIFTPIEKDFLRIDDATVEGIFAEVSLAKSSVDSAIDSLT